MIKIFPRLRYLLLILVLLPLSLERGYAQTFEDYLQPDRPEQSEGVGITAPGRLQVEWGIGASSHAKMAGLMLRYGIIQDLEMRLEGIMRKRGGDTPRFTNLNLSSKLNLFSGEGLIPAMTLVGYLCYAPDFQSRPVTSDLCLAFENAITSQLALTYNLASSDGMRGLFVVTELSYTPSKRWNCFVECYGNFRTYYHPEHGADIGMRYTLSPSLELELCYGRTHSSYDPISYASLGGTWRL